MTGFSEEPAAYAAKMDKASFLKWIQEREGGRYELKDGEIVMHAGSTRRHAWISGRFLTAFNQLLDQNVWVVAGSDAAIEIGEDIRYPDVVVERLTDDGSSPTTGTPVVLIEVLSPSSVGRDMHEKLGEYASLPSLQVYIVASQDEPICWVWQRTGEGRSFTKVPVEISGRDKTIELAALGIALPLAEIYRGTGTP